MYKHLTQYELYYIWFNCINNFIKKKVVAVAKDLSKHRSTVYRAIKFIKENNWEPDVKTPNFKLYRRNKKSFMVKPRVLKYVKDKLKLGWSPEVISGRMKKEIKCKISFKTIYNYIRYDRANGGNLYKLLAHQGKRYKYGISTRGMIPNRLDISLRPKIVDSKMRIGDLEGDTIVGIKGGSKECLMTLVDRASKYSIIRKLPNKTAISVEKAMTDSYDNSLLPFLTVTYDNGTEFANHQNISDNLGCNIYFARPYRSSDRGLNEHTNGLIRRFFPKKTDFAYVSEEQVQYVQNLLNSRPRKSLNYLTPDEVINKYLTNSYKKMLQLT